MISGIICEFNPFHKGHKYLIDTVKNDGAVVCAMSGSFVQRGEFAVFDKFTRAKTAVENGADLVIEIPCAYSLKSAEGFARAGVRLLEATNTVEQIAFGAECDNIELLKETARQVVLKDKQIKQELKSGVSYPAARRKAVGSELLDTPNNILAIEYLKAASLPCTAVKRIGEGHDTEDRLYSASAIRKELSLDEICSLKNCEVAVLSKLRTMTADDFLNIEDVSEGLENRIVDSVSTSLSIEELYDKIKTKRYAHSRIRRIILKSYLGITKDFSQSVPYIRVLAFNGKGREILAQMKKNADLPIISRYSDVNSLDEYGRKLFELECKCTDLYNLGFKAPLPCGTEQRSRVVIV